MLEIWGRRTSSNVQAVVWCATELGLTFKRYDLGHRFGGLDTPEFLAMNPNGTIPVIRDHGGPPIWETGAVLRYLCASYGEAPFWPGDLSARAQVDKWVEWAKINVAQRFTVPVFWRVVRGIDPDPALIAQAVVELDRTLAVAEAQLGRFAHLAGAEFTLADIQLGHLLFRYFEIDIERADLPNLRQYYARLEQRPAFRDHVMVPYDDLRP